MNIQLIYFRMSTRKLWLELLTDIFSGYSEQWWKYHCDCPETMCHHFFDVKRQTVRFYRLTYFEYQGL